MKGMVLCAGLGTRLRPVTNVWPKPAVPLLGQPLLRATLAVLKHAGVAEVAINTHHLPQVMEATARAECARAGLSLTVVHEAGVIQGTGGGICGLWKAMPGDDVVVMNGDVLFGLDLRPVLEAHRARGAAATMVLLPMPEGESYNAVEVTGDGVVRRIAGHGPGGPSLAPWHFSGVHVLSRRVFDFFASEGPEDINRDVYPRVMAAGLEVYGYRLTERSIHWSDLGTPARYAATHQQLLFGQVQLDAFGEASPFAGLREIQPRVWAHPTATLGDARISGPAWFGAGCVLGAGARIGAAVSVGPGAMVGAGAHLNRVAVLDGASVPPRSLIEDALVVGTEVISTR